MSTKLKLISNDGSYLRAKFDFDNSIWTLIGTESIQSQVNTFRLTQEQKTEQLMITAHDNNKYLISLYKSLQTGYLGVEEINKELYCLARNCYNNKTNTIDGFYLSDTEISWIGYMASANGRFFEGGYSGISKTKIGTERNYIKESISGIKKQIVALKGIEFICSDFILINPTEKSIIYCDPPYKGTKQYSTSKDFNYSTYYDKLRDLSALGHKVFCSEYEMPNDFKCIWQQELKSSLSANGVAGGNKISVEKLFTI